MAPFTRTLSLGALQSQKPGARNPPREAQWQGKKLPSNREKPWAGPGLRAGTFLLRVGRVKEEEEREREGKGREGEQTNTTRAALMRRHVIRSGCLVIFLLSGEGNQRGNEATENRCALQQVSQ